MRDMNSPAGPSSTHIRMAESNAALNRSLHLHRDTQFAAGAIYQQMYGCTDSETGKVSIPATFQVGSRIIKNMDFRVLTSCAPMTIIICLSVALY
ncbi:unnamed protein product [Callosobruchus maculatus]|uniref:Uncharacterized protein n=1 Tax=Callosobruchus maculatus TaxID=64391 RepID=A0A653BFM7_CALMS|nr:unnamed protein product [Callosobruchus maculatus]